jgi:twitching motility two-component system response regulator PilH
MARVLVIDDDEAITTLLLELLNGEGHQARSALNYAALKLAAEWQPDLIFLDLMMPVLDGFAIRRALQHDPRTRSLPVVAMSAGRNLRKHSADLTFHGYLPKPFDIFDVLAWVDQLTRPPRASRPPLEGGSSNRSDPSPSPPGAMDGF